MREKAISTSANLSRFAAEELSDFPKLFRQPSGILCLIDVYLCLLVSSLKLVGYRARRLKDVPPNPSTNIAFIIPPSMYTYKNGSLVLHCKQKFLF